MNRIAKLLVGVVALAVAFAACNNEPPECTADTFSPLRCEMVQLSGKKIDTIIVYHIGLDSVIYRGSKLPAVVAIPLDIAGDTSYVQFTISGKTKTVVESYSSVLCVASTPEMRIINLDCGPVYCYHDLDFGLKSVFEVGVVPEIYNDSVYNESPNAKVDTVNYKMSIDSLLYFTSDVDQDYEIHAKIFF